MIIHTNDIEDQIILKKKKFGLLRPLQDRMTNQPTLGETTISTYNFY